MDQDFDEIARRYHDLVTVSIYGLLESSFNFTKLYVAVDATIYKDVTFLLQQNLHG